MRLAAWLVGFGLMIAGPVLAQPTPSPQLAAAQAAFEALPEAERRAIQSDLMWTGALNSAPTGGFGPLTFRAINARKGGAGNGILDTAERRALAREAQAAREAAGFRIVADDRTGARIGVPERLLPKREALPSGTRWQSADGRVTLDLTMGQGDETLEALYKRGTAANPNIQRRITYSLLRPDFFVISGETPTGRFYRRLAAGPAGLRGFSLGYDRALSPELDRLVVAVAASFEPFPTGPPPAAPPATAAPALPPRPTERAAVALMLGERLAVTASLAVEGCRGLSVGGRPARATLRDEAAGLVLVETAPLGSVAPLGTAAASEGDALVLSFAREGASRGASALPARIGPGGELTAPVQPGQAGSPVFDRTGALLGVVRSDPGERVLVAGVVPARRHALAPAAAIAVLAAKGGMTLGEGVGGGSLSTGALVERRAGAVKALSCTL